MEEQIASPGMKKEICASYLFILANNIVCTKYKRAYVPFDGAFSREGGKLEDIPESAACHDS
jgi:hypothetical protein